MAKGKKKKRTTDMLNYEPPIKHFIEEEHDTLKYGQTIDSADQISSGGVYQAEAGASGIIEELPLTSVESRRGGKP